jgi:hypothetical protein
VTIAPFDYDAALATVPTTWRDRGMHFHAYSWRGDGRAFLDNDAGRNDPGTELPPNMVHEWLRKPQRLLRGAFITPDEAAEWMRVRYTEVAGELAGDIADALPPDRRALYTLHDLRCGNDVVIGHWLRGGGFIHLAVLSVPASECARHTA